MNGVARFDGRETFGGHLLPALCSETLNTGCGQGVHYLAVEDQRFFTLNVVPEDVHALLYTPFLPQSSEWVSTSF